MALSFPINPTTGQIYSSGSSAIYEWIVETCEVKQPQTSTVFSASLALPSSYVKTAQTASYVTILGDGITVNYSELGIELTGSGGGGGVTPDLQAVTTAGNQTSQSIAITGSLDVLGGITGSLLGSASYSETANSAQTAVSASHSLNADAAITASYSIDADNAVSASHALNADNSVSASYSVDADNAVSASHALNADNSVSASNAVSASYSIDADNAVSASHALNSDAAISSSHALNADAAVSAADSATVAVVMIATVVVEPLRPLIRASNTPEAVGANTAGRDDDVARVPPT
jgi:hypothetical protein